MNISRHISIDDEYIKKIEPCMEKHGGNMGAALRDMIHQAGKFNPCINSSAVDSSLFNWMLAEIDDRLEEHVNKRLNELEWRVNFSLECDSDIDPSQIILTTRGTPQELF